MTHTADPQKEKLPSQERREPHIDEKIKNLSNLFSLLGSDPDQNIHIIVQQACQLLDGTTAMYNRIDSRTGSLKCWAGCNLPSDFTPSGKHEGAICYEATLKADQETVVIEDLEQTPFALSDPSVSRHGFQCYLGHPVNCKGKTIGSLCVLGTHKRSFTDVD
ncbi:MAG: GAF domain-containing protein, partial [Desulfatitalea sp.]